MQKLTNFFLERKVGEVSNVIPSLKTQRTKNPIPPNGRVGGGGEFSVVDWRTCLADWFDRIVTVTYLLSVVCVYWSASWSSTIKTPWFKTGENEELLGGIRWVVTTELLLFLATLWRNIAPLWIMEKKMLILNFLDDFFFKKKLKDYVEDSLLTLFFGLRPKA